MRTFLLTFIAALALLPASSAQAAFTELPPLGDTKPSCAGLPEDRCGVLVVRQTGFQAKVGTTRAYSTVKQSGHLVAWTISLLGLSKKAVTDVSRNFGGAPRAAIVVLSPLGKSRYRVVRKGPLIDLTKYLGTTPTFALPTALAVKKGQIVALTVPTWAPILQLGLGGDTSWRSSRPMKETIDDNFGTQRALVGDSVDGNFSALYQRARLAYSATFLPVPTAAKQSRR